jgi:hypothetical protein
VGIEGLDSELNMDVRPSPRARFAGFRVELTWLICRQTSPTWWKAEIMLGTRRTIAVAVSVGKEDIEPEYVATCYRRFWVFTGNCKQEQRGSQCAQAFDESEGGLSHSSGCG